MQNIELLYKYNKSPNIKQCKKMVKLVSERNKGKYWLYNNTQKIFYGYNISDLLHSINYILSIDKFHLPISINLNEIEFADKLVYVVLECIYYYLINIKNRNISFNFKPIRTIKTEGIKYSPLCNMKSYEDFLKRFKSDYKRGHFRKLINFENLKPGYLSEVSTDIYYFFNHLGIIDEVSIELSETITELIGNAIEHGNSDCLFDIDITDKDYIKFDNKNKEEKYYGINVVVLNFSEKLFFSEMQNNFKSICNISERHEKVYNAKKFHMDNKDDYYKEIDFYTVAAFQHKISGDLNKRLSGGVGLTSLIKSLEEKADEHNCYMLSGKRSLFFWKEFLQFDNDQFVGFNSSHNFLTCIPDRSSLGCCETFFPGTAYNLNFAIKKGEIDNEE